MIKPLSSWVFTYYSLYHNHFCNEEFPLHYITKHTGRTSERDQSLKMMIKAGWATRRKENGRFIYRLIPLQEIMKCIVEDFENTRNIKPKD